ncbi:MAG: zinc-binding dehydrogenase, partial [Pseudomonadota bacterium]
LQLATRCDVIEQRWSRGKLEATAGDLFDAVASGTVTIPVNQTYALSDAATAHRDLEGRATVGATVLIP